jgi:hypothetical protein
VLFRSREQPPQQQPPDDSLACIHFSTCPGCTLQHGLWQPPVAAAAREFFAPRLAAADSSSTNASSGFVVHPGPVHGWRCRAKLAVRGRRGAPQVGLFERGSHAVTSIIPDCRSHHPRINAAALLVQRVAAALAVPLYQEQEQQQQQQQQQRGPRGSSGGSSKGGGALRYLQLTALPAVEGGRAEEDEVAQVQVRTEGEASQATAQALQQHCSPAKASCYAAAAVLCVR